MAEQQPSFPNHFAEVMLTPRINLAPVFHLIHEQGFKKLKKDPLDFRRGPFGLFGYREPNSKEAIEIYHKGKVERYGLTAEIIARVIDRAVAERPERGPFGLIGTQIDYQTWQDDVDEEPKIVTWIGLPDPFRVLNVYMQRTLLSTWEDELESLNKLLVEDPDSKLARNYSRLLQWSSFYNDYLPKFSAENKGVNLGEGPYALTLAPSFTDNGAGIETASRLMSSFLRVIPVVCERDLPEEDIWPDFLTQVARNSYPLLGRIAMLPFDEFGVFDSYISSTVKRPEGYENGYFDPMLFRTIKGANGIRVDLDPDVLKGVERAMGFFKSTGQKFRIGCPAMVSVDGQSAVQKLWDWHVDIGANIYDTFWPSLFEPAERKQKRFDAFKKSLDDQGLVAAGIHF